MKTTNAAEKDIHQLQTALIQKFRKYQEMKFLPVDKVKWILDVGAHSGGWTVQLKQSGLFPEANYFLIEGNREQRQFLETVGHPFALALVGDVDGEKVNYYKGNTKSYPTSDYGNSIYRENSVYFSDSFVEQRTTFTIDSILAQDVEMRNVSFDIIKFDIQGGELKALKGAIQTISKGNPLILTEVSILPMNGVESPSFFEIHKFMNEHDYYFFDVVEQSHLVTVEENPKPHMLVQMDVAWLKRENVCYPLPNGGGCQPWPLNEKQ